MKSHFPKKTGIRIIIVGSILATLGFLTSFINLFNIYGKAGAGCIGKVNNLNCNISNNLLINHIALIFLYSGIAIVAIGVVISIVNSSHSK
ncbi:MAG TPA: hypothetical protein VIH90_06640 [Candidatus Saccharimonadales bacterium]